ncbi:dynein axonemal assembly factor 1-like isoform X1 [Cloeon dipterum]|uniref:dynein axonemal assembly factor 1-like isoform X1 n=1 Tax=Cloeon dipterum TaxID=197152 RepID=UPI00321FF657
MNKAKAPVCAPDGKITKDYLYKVCSYGDGMYSVPHLNNILYLHYQGIRQIENLDDYTNLKCLYLQNNVIRKIENLGNLKQMTQLFLNENCIEKIENLEHCQQLDKIDLSKNKIQAAENLSCLKNLTSLDLSYNSLEKVEDISHLAECASLTLLRLSHNKLADPDIINVLSKLEKMRALFLDGNPILGVIPNYRKTVILAFPELCYLDGRPVQDEERKLAEAWNEGGQSAEEALKIEWKLQKEQDLKELHLKMYERMKQRYPELYKETESEDLNDEDFGQSEMKEVIPIKMPWQRTRPTVLNDHARKLVEEIEWKDVEEQIPDFEEMPQIENSDGEATVEQPQCILEYIHQLGKEKTAEVKIQEQGFENLPEELHYSLDERMEIWQNFMTGTSDESAEDCE